MRIRAEDFFSLKKISPFFLVDENSIAGKCSKLSMIRRGQRRKNACGINKCGRKVSAVRHRFAPEPAKRFDCRSCHQLLCAEIFMDVVLQRKMRPLPSSFVGHKLTALERVA